MKNFSRDISLVLGGSAGMGIQTIEATLVSVLKREGYHVFASKEYMSRIRGGSNSTEIRITNKRRASFVKRIDFLFALDADVIPHLEKRITSKTIILGERQKVCRGTTVCQVIDVPFTQFANELGNPIYTSTVAVGIVLGMFRADEALFETYLRERFARKGNEIVEKNIEAGKKGYDFGKHIAYNEGIEVNLSQNKAVEKEILIDGNDALGLGILASGCNYISSYPMSPGTGILTFLAQHKKEFGIVIDQAEDEISAINHSIGAWYAGARAIVSTSGGGFDLMTEGVSLSGIIETPIVVHIGQRPGPATGLPTRTEQADLNLVLYAGHGEFPRAVFAPGTHEEAFFLAQQAFFIADKYQIPVFILTDQYFLDSIRSFPEESLQTLTPENHIIKTDADYKRYALTPDGISPRGVPGYGQGLVGIDSDEHDEDAHITESAEMRVLMHEKRLGKIKGIREEALLPTEIGDVHHAEMIVISWGSNKGVLEEALIHIDDERIAGVHFSQVYPLPENTKKLFAKKKVVVLENNASGQFANLLKLEYGIKISESILKYDGDPFFVEEVVKRFKTLIKDFEL
ncbi:MAG: 2-oxoacid:acceptor oxidoreductase subunit alpha [Candidatus Moranbacteria bacterium]|nr:2-oxoacid:acceptor oxidoreductase subunit alpha [Candidatus Moranbacteria bacterium]MDD3964695.1 2-oxoacid:acceptor oxidoreductase subunit alpha [Candidatus Moranbacteria bacterium]